ncbi:MAG: glycosyltransferase, partial [Parvularculaceae bacterium]|nr:glycosyltransferase [Parvularculaceae bacterium]
MTAQNALNRKDNRRFSSTTPASFVVTPPDGARRLRETVNLRHGERFRLSYLPGPGDVYGTFQHWRENRLDPRVPTVAYSTMFYEFCAQVGAEAQILTSTVAGEPPDSAFRFDHVDWTPWRSDLGTRARRLRSAARCVVLLGEFKPHVIVVASDMEPLYVGMLGCVGAPVVLSMHNTFWPMGAAPHSFKSRIKRRILRAAYSNVRAAICTSAECERQLRATQDGRELQTFVHAPQPVALRDQSPGGPPRRLAYAGRIEPEKGVFDLLRSFDDIAGDFPETELVFCGEGG